MIEDIYESLEDSLVLSMQGVNKLFMRDYKIIPSYQNGLEPQDTYLSVNVLNMSSQRAVKSGALDTVFVDGVEYARDGIITHYEALCQMTFVGPKAGAYATDTHANIMAGLSLQEFHKNNISVTRNGDLRKNPQLRGAKWVNEFAFDLYISYAILSAALTGEWVEKITLNGELINIRE